MADVPSSPEELEPKAKHQFWEAHIQSRQQSGLTQVEYCQKHNLKDHRWWYWRKRITQPSDTDVTFVPLRFSFGKTSQAGISVVTPNGYRIEIDNGYDFSKLRQLFETVRGL